MWDSRFSKWCVRNCRAEWDFVKSSRYVPEFQGNLLPPLSSLILRKFEKYTFTRRHNVTSQNSIYEAPTLTVSGPIDWMLLKQNPPISKVLEPSAGNSLEEHPRYSQVPPSDGKLLTNGRYKQLLHWLTRYYRNLLLSTHVPAI